MLIQLLHEVSSHSQVHVVTYLLSGVSEISDTKWIHVAIVCRVIWNEADKQ